MIVILLLGCLLPATINACKDGFWGPNCTQHCTSQHCHNDACDVKTGKCISCEEESGYPVYWGPDCESKCPENCHWDTCARDTGDCGSCKAISQSGYPSYWGPKCENKCPENCNLDSCYQETGICHGCKTGFGGNPIYFGPFCRNKCSDNCPYAECKSDGSCGSCDEGTWGTTCDNNCTENSVSSHCASDECDKETGACSSCKDGWTGKFCDSFSRPSVEQKACSKYAGGKIESLVDKALSHCPAKLCKMANAQGAAYSAVCAVAGESALALCLGSVVAGTEVDFWAFPWLVRGCYAAEASTVYACESTLSQIPVNPKWPASWVSDKVGDAVCEKMFDYATGSQTNFEVFEKRNLLSSNGQVLTSSSPFPESFAFNFTAKLLIHNPDGTLSSQVLVGSAAQDSFMKRLMYNEVRPNLGGVFKYFNTTNSKITNSSKTQGFSCNCSYGCNLVQTSGKEANAPSSPDYYSRMDVGHCDTAELFISDNKTCELAAQQLQLASTTVVDTSFSPGNDSPHGCYYKPDNEKGSQLFFNPFGVNNSDDASRQSICRAGTDSLSLPVDWLSFYLGGASMSNWTSDRTGQLWHAELGSSSNITLVLDSTKAPKVLNITTKEIAPPFNDSWVVHPAVFISFDFTTSSVFPTNESMPDYLFDVPKICNAG